jgi:hypothetical protein
VKNERLPATGQWDARFGVDYAGYFIILCKNGPEALTLGFWQTSHLATRKRKFKDGAPRICCFIGSNFFLQAFKSLFVFWCLYAKAINYGSYN